MQHFDALQMYSCGKQAIYLFLTMFSTPYGIYFSFWMHFKLSSAICFNLDQSKILSPGYGLLNSFLHILVKVLDRTESISDDKLKANQMKILFV